MAISREDVDAGLVDFSDLIDPDAEPIGPIHPGRILWDDWLEPLGLSAERFAAGLGVSVATVTALIHGDVPITAELALRLARYFGTEAQSWINLQVDYDFEVARALYSDRIATEVTPLAA